MHLLNLGILAHVDAGKTSLTERLLRTAGVTDETGSVEAGTTRTDTLALERQRGITIKSAVVSFPLDGVTVNLIDTPGHPDFARAWTSGWRWSLAPCRTPSSRPSRTPSARRWARDCTAGRSPTARSP
ncbi:GTP-binding protein [Streptomyces sp. NPDC051636]|uniref:GTP-binding protein n=1 Tax=Streptomyces sp. NPDC051636 TaxID=3365663 RepID=UPI00379E7C47